MNAQAFRELLMPRRITEVVDIGANPIDGDPPYKPMLAAGLCRVTGFEPQEQALAALQQKKGPSERYLPYAVGDGNTHTLNICRGSGLASLFEPDPATLSLFDTLKSLAEVVRQVSVATRKLDDITEIQHMDFLKIDIQGGELSVFQGGTARLEEAVAIQTEVSFVTLYRDQPPLGAIDLELRRRGFIPHCFAAINKWPISPCVVDGNPRRPLKQLLEADIVYVRDFSRPESMSDEQLKHLALIAHHCYGSIDLALRCVMLLVDRKALAAVAVQHYLALASNKSRTFMPALPEALAQAKRDHRAGQLQAAEPIYRQILQLDSANSEVYYLLGALCQSAGRLDEAVENLRQAVRLKPDHVEAHNHLGITLAQQGRQEEAIKRFRQALRLKPEFTDAQQNLNKALAGVGGATISADIPKTPGHTANSATELNRAGISSARQGELDQAIASFRRAVQIKPDFAEAHNNLGIALADQGKLDEAVACYRQALYFKPAFAAARNSLGDALRRQGKPDEAVACFRGAVALDPECAEAHIDLGAALEDQRKLEEALVCYRRAVELAPGHAVAHNNLGNVLKAQGKLDEAVVCYRRALELKPGFVGARSNLVYSLNFCLSYDAKTIYEEHGRWNQQHAVPLAKFIQPHSNERSANRRLRIGYVSPDFRDHVVGRNLLPLFREHDRQQFEILCYAQVFRPDVLTDRFQSYADIWRNVAGLTDEALAQLIREDRIDILVDLTLHMAHNRLLVFARKPVPVQVTFAGYPGTTGMSAIDYRLTDPYLDPPGLDDRRYAEESIRLRDTFWCYDPLSSEPEPNPLPFLKEGHVAFGCLNNFCKINAAVLKLWAQVLKSVDHSQLMILAAEGTHRQRTLDLLEREGVASDRVTFVGNQPRRQYLELYHRIDIGLDTFPYNGHTTSLDSLWMGVPVITLVGQTEVGRAGFSQLSNLGLVELIADTPEQFVRIAVELAKDPLRLSDLRESLRDRMQNSPLMDAPRFARSIEAAYRTMWQRWCFS